MHRFIRSSVVVTALVGLVATGCSNSSTPRASTTTTVAIPKLTGTITVSAAASLTEAFEKIAGGFTIANRAAIVTFNFGSTSTIETQIEQGAPADVFASADEANMDKLAAANHIAGASVVFAKNKLVIVTKPGNPQHVKTLADLANLATVSLCAETVPCGKYAAQVLQTAGVTIPETKVTRNQDVKSTLAAVATGDADAAIVYVTDAKSAGGSVAAVTIPDAQNAIATYPVAVVAASGNAATAKAFVEYVISAKGQATLRSFGFLPPS